jgi:ATP-binding cassette subfamily C protein
MIGSSEYRGRKMLHRTRNERNSTLSGAPDPVRQALGRCRSHFVGVALFSATINLLYLTPTIYMMQVYDRVLSSGSGTTLLMLSLVGLAGLATLSLLDWLRSRVLIRATARFDKVLAAETLRAILSQPALSRLERAEAMRQFDTLRQGIGGSGVLAAFDAPWAPIYIVVAFLLHPALGALSLVAALVLLGLAWSNERATHKRMSAANEAASQSYASQAHVSAYAAEVRALGMHDALINRQLRERARSTDLQLDASLAYGSHSGLMKFVRLTLQSAALGVGGYLAINGAISGGAVFAASLLLSKSVQPIEQLVGAWKPLLGARDAWHKISGLLINAPATARTRLPDPTGLVEVDQVTVLTPQNERVAVADISFRVEPGEIVGVVGLSGAGKSSLLRALGGAVLPARGMVRFDGASYADWDSRQITRHIGYLPQEFVLFPGTVRDNISRFAAELGEPAETIDAAVIAAAQLVGVHNAIVRLPQGYDTLIGMGGVGLSAGQTQRIALARALYGEPRVLILDEPNAHLDAEADYALIQLLSQLKRQGVTVILAAHSGDLLASVDKLLLLQNGRIARFGPLAENLTARKTILEKDA